VAERLEMRGRVLVATSFLCLIGVVVFAACLRAHAATPTDSLITVAGNRHLDAAMIRSHFHPGVDDSLDAGPLDAAVKSLYRTGLFEDVKITRDGGHILVTFEGNKKVKDDELKTAAQSKAGGPLSRAIVHDDVERIIELYREHGYFDVRIEPKAIIVKSAAQNTVENERVSLVFEIKEGDKLAVRQIRFVGGDSFPLNKLKGLIKTGETNSLSFLFDNDAYDADRIENDRDLLRHFYLGHGYTDVRVRPSASYEADRKGVVVTFSIEEGPQYRLGRVDIESSLQSIDATALRSYLRSQPGEIYDADAIDKTVDDLTIGLAKTGAPFVTVLARSERLQQQRQINLVYAIDEANTSTSSVSTSTAIPRRAMT
jgi:outer membrane protein insertion porin family